MYVLCSAQNKDAVRLTLEQIDVVKRMCNSYEELELVMTSQGDAPSCKRAFKNVIAGGMYREMQADKLSCFKQQLQHFL